MKQWSADEDMQLACRVLLHSQAGERIPWLDIVRDMPGINNIQCQRRWIKVMHPTKKTSSSVWPKLPAQQRVVKCPRRAVPWWCTGPRRCTYASIDIDAWMDRMFM